MSLAELLTAPEGKTLEFKRDLSSLKPILKSLVAFANTAGGTLVIGRADDGAVVGVTHALAEEERLANTIADGIRPAMTPDIDIVTLEGKALLLVRVPHWRGPFYVRAEGPEAGVYVRLGSTNRQAGPEMLAELQRAIAGLSFDQLPSPDLSPDDLDPDRLQRFFDLSGRKASQEHLSTLGVLTLQAGSLVPSYGGLILFGRDAVRQRVFPDAAVDCARFRGPNKAEFLDRLRIAGTVLEALDEAPKFIRRNTRLAASIQSMRRRDIPEYPEVSLREVLVNAVAHADYSLTGMRIRVAIFADRMEIESPGMLPFGMTLDDLKAGVSRTRNRVIARVLRELGLLEEWGSGYRRIVEDCRTGGYPPPEWEERGAALRVVFAPHPEVVAAGKAASLPADVTTNSTIDVTGNVTGNVTPNVPGNVRENVPGNERQHWFLDKVAQGIDANAEAIVARFGVTRRTALRDIADLKAKQIIEFVGPSKKGAYRIKNPS
jgi:ATP-dependent DNA helicase RecG